MTTSTFHLCRSLLLILGGIAMVFCFVLGFIHGLDKEAAAHEEYAWRCCDENGQPYRNADKGDW